jgi:hypothetical protein
MWAEIGTPFRRTDRGQRSNIMTSRMRLAGVALFLVGAIVVGSEPSATAQSEQSRNGLQGTWHVTVTPYDCLTNLPLGFSFHALLAFASGGTLSGESAAPHQPGQFSASFGVWERTGVRTYRARTDAFILFPGGPFPAGRQEIRHSIRVSADGSRFSDQASLDYFDVNDLPVSPQPPSIPGCAVAAGRRVQ